eukprot:scaffold6871_cov29-Tisochrysis_lutea.AAC.5
MASACSLRSQALHKMRGDSKGLERREVAKQTVRHTRPMENAMTACNAHLLIDEETEQPKKSAGDGSGAEPRTVENIEGVTEGDLVDKERLDALANTLPHQGAIQRPKKSDEGCVMLVSARIIDLIRVPTAPTVQCCISKGCGVKPYLGGRDRWVRKGLAGSASE